MPRHPVVLLGTLVITAACASPTSSPPASSPQLPPAEVEHAPAPAVEIDPVLVRAAEVAAAAPGVRWRYLFEIAVGDDGSGLVHEPIRTQVDDADGPADPRFPLVWIDLLAGIDGLEPAEVAEVDGEVLQRYDATLHLDRVRDLVPLERVDAVIPELTGLEALVEEMGGEVSDPLAVALWVRGDGALRRYAIDVPVAPGTFGEGASTLFAVELYDYG